MDILTKLEVNEAFIKVLFGVKKIGIFGSFARGDSGEQSDVDVLVEFEPDRNTVDNFMDLLFYLEDLFGKKVDLITTGGLHQYIRPFVEMEVVWCEA
jgi:predicted nucleotidyltransferase